MILFIKMLEICRQVLCFGMIYLEILLGSSTSFLSISINLCLPFY